MIKEKTCEDCVYRNNGCGYNIEYWCKSNNRELHTTKEEKELCDMMCGECDVEN